VTRAPARVAFAGALVACGVLGSTAPASAHAVTGVKATNYKSEIVGVAGGPLEVRLLDLGRRIELVNRDATDIVVLGYEGEPWLRVGPDGVFENESSNSAYLERQRRGRATGSPPDPAEAAGPPEWRRTGSGSTLVWRDRRTHVEGPTPSQVARDPDARHVIVPRWTVEAVRGETRLAIVGRISYEPPPTAVPWVVAAVVLFAAPLLMLRSPRAPELLALGLALLIAVDIVHSFANAAVSGGSLATHAGSVLRGGSVGVTAWILGALSIPGLHRRTDAGLILAGVSALMIAFYGGVTDAAALATSQVPSALSPFLLRFAVTFSLGFGFGIAAATAYQAVRGRASRPTATVRG
jgi:hypothetical protein